MSEILIAVGSGLAGALLMLALLRFGVVRWSRSNDEAHVATLLANHFSPTRQNQITITERRFPLRMCADLQRAIDKYFSERRGIRHFCGVRQRYAHLEPSLADCVVSIDRGEPVLAVPPQHEEVDIGEDAPVRCLKNGLWLVEEQGTKFAVLLGQVGHFPLKTGIQIQIATPTSPEGTRLSETFFRHLEESVLRSDAYRGKILSLEQAEHSYSGEATGIKVHRLRVVERGQVILPSGTVDLLDRNVLDFARRRPQFAKLGLATKKGVLFYGPPGTGKTHTIHYLAHALAGHTTLLITAEQVGLLSEYMTLARLLQPSIVVIEDVDLIAGDRGELNTCEEVLLNRLLNEMDGLGTEADIFFILTTNRPETLERALSSRPGRVDQAIEFPLPDAEGRRKLVRLYAKDLVLSEDLVTSVADRTESVSAAFIKELMRRSAQFQLERNGSQQLDLADVENAINEMVFRGGSLNLKLLGADSATWTS